jgi:hypothetical protein
MDNKTELMEKLRNYLVHRDAVRLRDLSGEAGDLAFITQEKDTVNIAIIAYALYKIFLKTHYQKKFEPLANNALNKINSGDLEGLVEDIKQFDIQHGFFQGNVVKRARIKIGARLYTRGLSLSKAAQIVSVNISDLLEYSGGTQVHEKPMKGSVKDRLNVARELFE